MKDIGADNGGYLCRYVIMAEHLELLRQIEISEPQGTGLPKVDIEEIALYRSTSLTDRGTICPSGFGTLNTMAILIPTG